MLTRSLTVLALCAIAVGTVQAQWVFEKNLLTPEQVTELRIGQLHGLAVDPDGKIWLQPFGVSDSVFVEKLGVNRAVQVLYVLNPDGSQADFSPIKILNGNGVADTLGGFINAAGAWETKSGRGLKADADGNILVSQFNVLYKIDYKTGNPLAKVLPGIGTLGAAASDAAGNVYVGAVVGGAQPIKMYDPDFNFLENAVDTSRGFSRTMEVMEDGTILWAGYTNHAIFKYSRPDEFSPYDAVPDTVMKGFDSESMVRHPVTGHIWASAGSQNDLPNRFPGVETNYLPRAHYAFDPSDLNTPVDGEVIELNLEAMGNNPDPRPRGIAFSPDGNTAYTVTFAVANVAPQVFKKMGTGLERDDYVGIPDGYLLKQNYPNPFNPSTMISFEIPVATKVTLRVYDMLGRVVATLVDGNLTSGSYTYSFDASKLSSGVYLYEVSTASGVMMSNKMTLIK
jgi:sugar lactone lactonase YvrE